MQRITRKVHGYLPPGTQRSSSKLDQKEKSQKGDKSVWGRIKLDTININSTTAFLIVSTPFIPFVHILLYYSLFFHILCVPFLICKLNRVLPMGPWWSLNSFSTFTPWDFYFLSLISFLVDHNMTWVSRYSLLFSLKSECFWRIWMYAISDINICLLHLLDGTWAYSSIKRKYNGH